MKTLGLSEIRKTYLDFFKSKDHLILKSYPLIPENDKSLLLINAGMAPLKDYFTGIKKMSKNRAASSQRCIRTADIERVGKTHRHATFFEMLGNFSFGDYFKKEAIQWAWELLTEVFEIPKELLSVTVFEEDDEAYDLWHKMIGLDETKISRLGKEDNFWELEVGPCGPCSEIFVDRGEKYGCGDPDCGPACDCDRYLEVWNLVFTQFDKDEFGEYHKLANPNIDTGMGLERITLVLEDKDNIFEINAMQGIIDAIEKLSEKSYKNNAKNDESIRVIIDHCKAMTFMVFDGIVPSNEERGYVLRRLIRRAYRHGKLLGIKGLFLTEICKEVIETYGDEYSELFDAKNRIFKIIEAEERKFQETIEQGMGKLESLIQVLKEEKKTVLSGEEAFKLYDTYGFPLDLTKEILAEENLEVDEVEFNDFMQEQRLRSREARQNDLGWHSGESIDLEGLNATDFIGYDELSGEGNVLKAFVNNTSVEKVSAGEEAIVVLSATPFYGESGGQVGDIGKISAEGVLCKVIDTKKNKDNIILHSVEVIEGSLDIGMSVVAKVDPTNRRDIMRNHSATHLLHKALKTVVGEHIHQAGSLVDSQKLRFDITHYEAIAKDQLAEVEKIVNSEIARNLPVKTQIMGLEESQSIGAIGLFEDKYKEVVRVVSMGDFSRELCGGTHVGNTSEILMLKILSEASVSAGVRRIEAITGRRVYEYLLNTESSLDNIATLFKSTRSGVFERVDQFIEEKDMLIKENQKLKSQEQGNIVKEILSSKKEVAGINLVTYKFENLDIEDLRAISDKVRDKLHSCVVIFSSVVDGRILFLCTLTKDLIEKRLNAGKIVKIVAQTTGGNGGGRADSASAGGKDVGLINVAFEKAEAHIASELE